ncbi:disease resistance protein RPM1-like [Morus notabilis]|uniref:disease resistance protein RPM1-like n=1 Tax=Morus notabilis TaxID=981085 RepID=UPI000CED4F14|nr:disease resistance protein RPM1-like [Morus notabilis]
MGIGFDKEELVKMLVGEQPERLVISLAGSGGVGKTALASVVFRSDEVKKHFDCHAWINVSQSYSFENLLRNETKKICPEGEMDSITEVISRLNEYLTAKRYVIVFDGLWQTDFLQLVNDVFLDNNNGSRIIITTRDNAIAASCDVVQKVQPFSEERAWELFCIIAFRYEYECPPELKNSSLEIVRRCNGLPLLIWAVGDILSTKGKILSEWQMLLANIINEIGENQNPSRIEEVSRIFYQSYGDLPCPIRFCFLYFAIFPKGYLIPDLKLIKLWIAEGFIKEETGKTMEQVAERYLNELINRDLVQVSYVNY